MEVHHPHHIPKKLKEYLTEFFMLFAAVTLGFLAENFREHQIENNRAKEYLELFRSEILRNDKAIDSVLKFGIPVLQKNESLYFEMFSNEKISNEYIADSLDLMVYRFSNDKRIFELMKNSGSLRYIKDKNLIQEINIYESEADFAEFRTFEQESSSSKLFWDFLVRKMPTEFIIRWLNDKHFSYIMDLNPDYSKIYQLNKQNIDQKVNKLKFGDELKRELQNYIINKCTIQKLSVSNLKSLKKKSEPLLKHIDQYLEHN